MSALHLTNRLPSGLTLLSNDFIDHDMADANGEFIKIYLYLLRWSQDASARVSPETMADLFCLTENDVMRALLFWEKRAAYRPGRAGMPPVSFCALSRRRP